MLLHRRTRAGAIEARVLLVGSGRRRVGVRDPMQDATGNGVHERHLQRLIVGRKSHGCHQVRVAVSE